MKAPHDAPTESALERTDIAVSEPGTRFDSAELAPASVREDATRRTLGVAAFEERYTLEAALGEGGMGEVSAYRDRSIGRDVAIKRVRNARRQGVDMIERFLREGSIQGQLEHPSIVPVYDLRRDAAGDPALIMKRVRGKTFETLLLEHGRPQSPKSVSTRRLLDMFLRACEGIAYAHARGVIHRDLKPANIMVGSFGEVYVLDWGIAKLADASGHDRESKDLLAQSTDERATLALGIEDSGENKTGAGTVIGTPGYMSPEQFFGDVVDTRADLFALGLILFEILTGEAYHQERSIEELAKSFQSGVEWRPTTRRPDLYIPPELDELAFQATRRNKEERLASTAQFVRRLERYLAGEKSTELRQQASDECIETAREVLRRNTGGGLSLVDRRLVLTQIGKALAFDPRQEAAVDLLGACWSLPTSEVPKEVEEAIAETQVARSRNASIAARWAYASWFAYLPFCFMMGVRDWTTIGAATLFFAAAAILSQANVLLKRTNAAVPTLAFLAGVVGLAALSTMFGSVFFTPMIAMGGLVLYSVNHARKPDWIVLLLMTALVIGLPLAERFGLVSPSLVFEGGSIRIVPRAVSFEHAEWVLAFLVLVNAGMLITFLSYVFWMKRRLLQEQQTQAMQAWHLRQLFPVISEGALERRTFAPPMPKTEAP